MSTAFVGGGGRGIGRAIACGLAARGMAVAVSSRTADELAEVVSEIEAAGGRGYAVPADLASPEAVREAVEQAHRALGGLHVLVNCAGQHPRNHPVEEYPIEYWRQMLDVNLSAAFYSCRVAIPIMKEQGAGRIINVASVAGKMGAAHAAGYVAAKHGLVGLTKVLALELGPFGITANAICPGFVETRMTADKNVLRAWAVQRAAVPRVVAAEEVAALACFLTDAQSGAITGQAINVCCGLVM